MVHFGARLGRDDGLGVVGDAQAGFPQHVQVVGAVPHRECGLELHAAFGREVPQRVQLGAAVQNGFPDRAQ